MPSRPPESTFANESDKAPQSTHRLLSRVVEDSEMYMAGHKSLYIAIALFFSAVFISMILFSFSIEKKYEVRIRYDTEPILRRYPTIQNVEQIIWHSDSFGETIFGFNSYWVEGYIFLSNSYPGLDEIDDWVYAEDFSPDFKPDEISDAALLSWYRSEAFDKKSESEIMFSSRFCYQPEQSIIYFYAETG